MNSNDDEKDDEPKTKEGRFLTGLRRSAIRTAVQHLKAIDRMKAGERNPSRPPTVTQGTPPPPGDFLFDLAQLQLQNYTSLLDLTGKYADNFVDRMRHMAQRAGAATPTSGRSLYMRGRIDDVVCDEFQVSNQTRTPVFVCLNVSKVRTDDGCESFDMNARIEPAPDDASGKGWKLAPYQKKKFELSVGLHCPPFRPGHHFFAEVEVVIRGRAVEEIPIEIDVRNHGHGV